MINTTKKGFTLIELLIVIGILAVLATATVIIINPAEMMAQARDSKRVTDLDSLKVAVGTYIASVSSPDLDTTVSLCEQAGTKGSAALDPTTGTFAIAANIIQAGRLVDGTGWLPVKLSDIPGGSPVAVLPIDPTNSVIHVYRYACNNTLKTFEIDSDQFESAKFGASGLNLAGNDGGNQSAIYEVGTGLTL